MEEQRNRLMPREGSFMCIHFRCKKGISFESTARKLRLGPQEGASFVDKDRKVSAYKYPNSTHIYLQGWWRGSEAGDWLR